MAVHVGQTLPRLRCEATVRYELDLTTLRERPVACGQMVGISTLTSPGGETHGYCYREGHRGNVARRFGEASAHDRHVRDEVGDADCPACEQAYSLAHESSVAV